MMSGCRASFLAPMVFLVLIFKAHLQECKPGEWRVIMSSENDDITLKSGSYVFHYNAVIRLQSMWNGRRVVNFYVRHDGDVVIQPWLTNATVNITVKPGVSITITLHDVKESDSGDYVLYDTYRRDTLQCWTLYILRGEVDEYLEDGTFFNFTSFPSLSEETAARMNVTTSWLIGDREIDPGQPQLVDRSMHNQNVTYRIHQQSNDTITFFVGILKVACKYSTEHKIDQGQLVAQSMHNQNVTYRIRQQSNDTITFCVGILKVAYTGPVVLEPKQDIYVLTREESLPAIRCNGNCNPGCNTSWLRGAIVVSNTDVLELELTPDDVMIEFICHVANTYSTEQLNTRVVVFQKEEASQTAVNVLAAFVGVLTVTTLTLATCLYRREIWPCTIPCLLGTKRETDEGNVEMTGVTEQYEDLHHPSNADNMYDRINPESQQTDQQTVTDTYENTAMA